LHAESKNLETPSANVSRCDARGSKRQDNNIIVSNNMGRQPARLYALRALPGPIPNAPPKRPCIAQAADAARQVPLG